MVRKTFKRTESGKAKFPVLQKERHPVLPRAKKLACARDRRREGRMPCGISRAKKPPRARTWQLSLRNWRRTWKQWSGF